MDKAKAIKTSALVVSTVAGAVAFPPFAAYIGATYAPIVGTALGGFLAANGDKIIDLVGNVGSSVFANLASSGIWEAPQAFGRQKENQDLLRLLATAYLESIDAYVNQNGIADNRDAAVLLRGYLRKTLATGKVDDLVMLFPVEKKAAETSAQSDYANRIAAGDLLVEMANDDFSEGDAFRREIGLSLRRWRQEMLIKGQLETGSAGTLGLTASVGDVEDLNELTEFLAEHLPA